MTQNIEQMKKAAHFIQWDLNPNFKNIFKTLQENSYLSEDINIFEWKENIDLIIEELNWLEKNNWKIILKYFWKFERTIDPFLDRRLNDSPFFKEKNLTNEKKDLLVNIYKKDILLNRQINRDLRDIWFSSRLITWNNFLGYYDRITEIFDYPKEELQKIDKDLSEKITNQNVLLDIQIYIRDLVKLLLWKISILIWFSTKISFIEKFETRKKEKQEEAKKYFKIWIWIFVTIILINSGMFYYHFKESYSLLDFWKNFLWKNIYIFSIEIILFILAFYYLWLFKAYKKVIELYDSHILLIESDDYYKNDTYFMSSNSEKILEMRKENAQKIHDLPWKIFDIFNWKDSFSSELPVWKALDIINNLTKK